MQWLQDPNQSNVESLNNVRCEGSRHFRNKKQEYLKAKIDKLEINSRIRNIRDLFRGTNNFKKGYEPRTNIVKDEKGDLITEIPRYYRQVEELFLPTIECTWGQ